MKIDLERLKNDEEYYGKYGKQFVSNSDIDALLKNPSSFKQDKNQTVAMLEGTYMHKHILEPEKVGEIPIVECSTRNTKIYKEYLADNNIKLALLLKETEVLDRLISKIQSDMDLSDIFSSYDNEVPGVKEIFGVMFKGKADTLTDEFGYDLKSTTDISKFRRSAYSFNYDSQAFIYQELFGKPFKFVVACKQTEQIKMFECSPEFIDHGRNKVMRALEVWHKYFGPDAEFDVTTHIPTEIL